MEAPTDNGGCPPDCGHSHAEHVAFDLGVEQGENLGSSVKNPYAYEHAPEEWDAWETGFSVGWMNYKENNRTLPPAAGRQE